MILCTLLVTPAPASAILGPTEQAFPDTRSGEQSVARTITYATGRLRDEPPEPVRLGAVSITGPDAAAYTVLDDRCSGREVSSACVVTVAFTPARAGETRAELAVEGTDATARTALTGAGFVIGPKLVPSEPVLRFPSVPYGEISTRVPLAVTNEGDRTFTIAATAVSGPGAGDFVTGKESCAGARLEPGERCSIELVYAPSPSTLGGDAALELRTAGGIVETVELKSAVVVAPLVAQSRRAVPVAPTCSKGVSLKGARLRGGVLFVTVFAGCAAQFGVEARPLGRGRIKHVKRVATGGPGRSTVPVVRLKGRHRIRIVVRGRKSAAKTVR